MHYKRPFAITWSLLLFFMLSLTACSSLGVKPWEREILAKPDMALDENHMDTAYDDHIYFSKEASSGGRVFSGGGCGCN
ncbi:hypothetical protein A9Q99_19135 [Gammaproteobacteria bacterium 45_16_T64]|nr:hypothetical protein A9Q99_19135 [Gammaproteobacteria bacterium 45_16_T64]